MGEAAFVSAATEQASMRIRDSLPLRAELALVAFLAHKPDGVRQ
ncbi:hypothetical protein [Actinoplanes derwentensis]|nr:hypothetical protein [Actinoplanes derwentensis]